MIKNCTIENNKIIVNGETIFSTSENKSITEFLTDAYKVFEIRYPRFHKMDLACKLGILSSSILFEPEKQELNDFNSSIIISSNSGCSITDMEYTASVVLDSESSFPALFTYTLPSIVMGEICIKHKIKGENFNFITENFNKELIHNIIIHLFTNKNINLCLVGWVEVIDEQNFKSNLTVLTDKNYYKYLKTTI